MMRAASRRHRVAAAPARTALPLCASWSIRRPPSAVTFPASRTVASSTELSTSLSTEDGTPIFFYNDVYEVSLPPTHTFPMEKYRLVRE
eukprot:SAG31_NODE_33473_length_343_cov_1.045082_1_plen_88_part_10